MASISKGYTFASTELVNNTKLHSLVDSASINLAVGTALGSTTPSTGAFTTLSSNGATTIGDNTADAFTINPSAWTLANAVTITGTWTDLGTVTTVDINGGTLDSVQIGGTEATGELIVNDSNDYADGLGVQGTAAQVLTSAGAGVNPTWETPSTVGTVQAWARVTVSGGTPTLRSNYNVSSVADTAANQVTITWDTDFASDDYCVVTSWVQNTGAYSHLNVITQAAGYVVLEGTNQVGNPTEPLTWFVMAIGAQ